MLRLADASGVNALVAAPLAPLTCADLAPRVQAFNDAVAPSQTVHCCASCGVMTLGGHNYCVDVSLADVWPLALSAEVRFCVVVLCLFALCYCCCGAVLWCAVLCLHAAHI
jgi:hypothetical protein